MLCTQGIRTSVEREQAANRYMSEEMKPEDFKACTKDQFEQPSGTVFKFKDYAPTVFRQVRKGRKTERRSSAFGHVHGHDKFRHAFRHYSPDMLSDTINSDMLSDAISPEICADMISSDVFSFFDQVRYAISHDQFRCASRHAVLYASRHDQFRRAFRHAFRRIHSRHDQFRHML